MSSKKENMVKSPTCKFSNLDRKPLKQTCLNSQLKSPKCYIKITGSRYNGTFLLNLDNGLDDAIYHTMRDIEVALEAQTDSMGKTRVSPKNCLSSVFRCFGTSDLQTDAVCNKKTQQKSLNKPAECSLTATINKSDLVPLMSAVQSNPLEPSPFPENNSESVLRDVVDVFRTTLDQFRKENLSSFGAPPKILAEPPRPQSIPGNTSKTETVENVKHKELQKVSFIKFSQEEVLVIQPPKPSNNGSKEIEVGIEVKPKNTAANVGQSIKLAKDKVLIGMQDGRGILQINDGVPKRSLQMVIEEGVNGKPSMKFSLKEENPEEKEQFTPEQHHSTKIMSPESKEETPKNCINSNYNWKNNVSTLMNSHENDMDSSNITKSIKQYKSVESQVSCTRLDNIGTQPSRKQKCKSESTQYHISLSEPTPNISHCVCCTEGMKPEASVPNTGNECADDSQDTVLDFPFFNRHSEIHSQTDPRLNRMPYLVHTLHEPRSLRNSSAYFASDTPSRHRSFSKASNSKNLETSKRRAKNPKSSSFGSDYSSSSKCTKIFRDIREIGVKSNEAGPLGKKDATMTTSLVEDFERILQGMCGPSYLYHHPEHSEANSIAGLRHHKKLLKARKHLSDNLSFDQWTQTDSCNKEVPIEKSRPLKGETLKIRESGDGSNPRILRKKAKRTKSSAPQRVDDSSMSTSGLEGVLSSDSSAGSKHKIVFSMLRAANDNPLPKTSSGLVSKHLIPEQAKSFVGQRIFAAIEDHTSRPELLCNVKSTDSFAFPAFEHTSEVLLQGGDKVSVVNVALCDPIGPQLTDVSEEDTTEVTSVNDGSATTSQCRDMIEPKMEDEWNHNSKLQSVTSHRPSYPIRVKSKSCQNVSVLPTVSRSVKLVGKGIPASSPIKKLRYPHLTATDSRSMTAFNVGGILNFKEGGLKADLSLANFEKIKPRLDQALPSAIRSLLLPPLVFDNYEQPPICNCSGTNNTAGYWDLGVPNQNENDWCTSSEAFDPVRQVAIQRSLFKRTFFAMKNVGTAVTRKFSTFFRKLSFTHSGRKKDFTVTDSVVYVAIPLKKKSENIHLYPKAQ